jgi:two-component system invasion response regulator UvrY
MASGAPAVDQLAVIGQQTIRVVVIDDRPERRAVTDFLLERSPLLDVVGSAGTLAEAEAAIRAGDANAALVEVQMPVPRGLTLIGALRERFSDLAIVVCSFRDDAITQAEARTQGADGYLSKPLQVEDLLAVLRTCAEARDDRVVPS